LILNGFSTLLGNSVGRMFGSLFPPQPQFRGRQVVTLHNQRDFLFFRRHRYAFASATSAKLQEIGPRFTLKMRWLRKGLPAVTASDGSVPRGGDAEDDDEEIARQEKMDEDEAMEEMGKGMGAPAKKKNGGDPDLGIPPLDEEQEYEWKWKVRCGDVDEVDRADCSAKDGGVQENFLLVMISHPSVVSCTTLMIILPIMLHRCMILQHIDVMARRGLRGGPTHECGTGLADR
jgi:hypothetical protein